MARPNDPLDPLTHLSQTYAAEDFMAQRKRLREAARRILEEQERPTTYQLTDKDGEVTYSGPFQVGQRRYEGEYPQTPETAFKPTFKPADRELTWDDAEKEIKPILDETERFLAPGIYRESVHPEIREGESYGDYCARVGREYEAATGANAIRRPVPDSDGVREPAATGESGQRGSSLPGPSDRGCIGEDPCGDAGADPDRGAGQEPPSRTSGDASADGEADPADRHSAS